MTLKMQRMYADTAYNSEHIPPQQVKPAQGLLRKVLTKGQAFSFSKANDTISIALARVLKPSDMAKLDENNLYWDETELHKESLSGWGQLYFFFISMVKMVLMYMFPIIYLLWLYVVIFGELTWDENWKEFLIITFYGVMPCLLIYGHFKLVSAGHVFLAPFLKVVKVCSLNRQTGMVTMYKRGNKVRFCHPFIEFDCVLMSAPSPQGHLNYRLALIHRYNNYPVGVPLNLDVGNNEMVAEYHRLWNMIQRYMDVSQPLPDFLLLEPARERDPTTIEHDKKTGRKPRYWRDMTDEEYKIALEKLYEKQKNKPTSGRELSIFK